MGWCSRGAASLGSRERATLAEDTTHPGQGDKHLISVTTEGSASAYPMLASREVGWRRQRLSRAGSHTPLCQVAGLEGQEGISPLSRAH